MTHPYVMCDMTNSHVARLIHMWHDSFMWAIAHSSTSEKVCLGMWHDSFICDMTHPYVMCDMTHSHVTWLMHMTHSYVTWHIHMRNDTFILDLSHGSFICDMPQLCVPWLIHVRHASFMHDMACLIHMRHASLLCDMSHSHVTPSFICDVTHAYVTRLLHINNACLGMWGGWCISETWLIHLGGSSRQKAFCSDCLSLLWKYIQTHVDTNEQPCC